MSSEKVNPVTPATRLFVNGIENPITAGVYVTEKAKQHKLAEGIVKGILMHCKSGVDYDAPEEADKAAKKAIKAFVTECKADMVAHVKNKALADKAEEEAVAARKQEREAAAAAKDEDIKQSTELMSANLNDKKLVTVQTQLTESADKGISAVLGKKFALGEDGIVTPAEGVTKEDFAKAFSGLVGMQQTSGIISDRSAKTEAQIACAAKSTLGEDWVNLFSALPGDLSRIKKGITTFEICSKSKAGLRCFTTLPLSTTRALTEMKVTTTELEGGNKEAALEKNTNAKLEVLKLASAKIKELNAVGSNLTQTDAKNLVAEYKKSLNIETKERFKFFHISVADDGLLSVFGAVKLDPDLASLCAITVDYNGNLIKITKDGVKTDAISGPSDEMLAKVAAIAADREAANKKPEKASKAVKAATSDDDDEDDVKAPVAKAPKAKAKAKAPVVVEEDEDEDEDEDDADEEEDAPAPKVAAAEADDDDDEDSDEDEEEDD